MSSPQLVERVFPIRLSPFLLSNPSGTLTPQASNVILLTPNPEGAEHTHATPSVEEASSDPSLELGIVAAVPAPIEVEMTDDPGHVLDSQNTLLSETFEYAIQEDGSHGVIHGTRRAFTRCEDELIHIPGAIQSFGMLVALKKTYDDDYFPRIVSENSQDICSYSPAELFGLGSFYRAIPKYQCQEFHNQMQGIRTTYDISGKSQEPKVFALSFYDAVGHIILCWCAAHYLGGDVDLYVCEFELQDYSRHPMATPADSGPKYPIDTLGSDHMDLATVSSMHSRSQPVFSTPDILARGIDPSSSSVEVIGIATKVQKQFSDTKTVEELLDTIVGVVSELSGFNRVMVYKFDQDFNGAVVAELMDPSVCQDVYRGLHFPSTDIPPQARQLYMVNKVRVLFDRSQKTARLVGRSRADIEAPLDLTHAYLRAMSPVHLKYLANMEVRSSMSMSLESEGKLWGLIVCHSYGPTATRVPFTVREMSYFVGVAASTYLEKLLNADKLQARRIIATLQDQKNPNECITASSDELLKLFEADCGFLVIEGEARTIGRLASYTEAVLLLKYLFFRRPDRILFSSNLKEKFSDLHYPSGFKAIAGVLYIPLSGTTDDCVVFYRKNQLREVHWAGKPLLVGKFGTLEPRNSFRKWTEVVDGTSKSWTPEQANIAAMAQLVYGSFIRVWREKETAVKETRLKRLLLHDTSHKVRTPLNAVINYLEMALEKPLEDSTKDALTQSYNASKSLIYVIDDLLNLTGSTTGSIPQLCETFDLTACLEESLDPLKRLAREKGVKLVLRTSSGVSRFLRGDPANFQRAVSILVTNAIEHTSSGQILVEWNEVFEKKNKSMLHVAVTDSGPGLSERELDDLFQEFEQVPDEDFDEMSGQTSTPRDNVLRVGVGLAFVARYVKQRNGQLRVKSLKGQGSTFAIEVPFLPASRAPSLAARRDASPLPALPMPTQPAIASMGVSVAALTPTASGSGASPPLISATPTATPLEGGQTPTAHSLTIIVVDDNYINVQILKRRLTKMGHRVLVSRDGQESWDMFVQHQATIDFILMDLNMPIVDGWASTRMIREYEKQYPMPSRAVQSCGRMPIFAISGMLKRGDEQKFIDGGFDGWMPKPVDMRRLATYLAGALDVNARNQGDYDGDKFEQGGWFRQTEPMSVDVVQASSPGTQNNDAPEETWHMTDPGISALIVTDVAPATTVVQELATLEVIPEVASATPEKAPEITPESCLKTDSEANGHDASMEEAVEVPQPNDTVPEKASESNPDMAVEHPSDLDPALSPNASLHKGNSPFAGEAPEETQMSA
ncbi:phytochrome-like protein [Podospora didyma]|uniref:Phytochrome-like protein n=1 Tax=Podospora didyma TaxID=330526 RepID=A0AAE0P8W4_9PEZI|nr:phytochrome-like protein [Podospora didyma]